MIAALSVRGLCKRFGAVIAAEDIDIDIAAGQRIGLMGANGAGKTTFINMVTGYLKPDGGRIMLEGEDISRRSPRDVARLGITRSFQIPQLFIDLSAAENLIAAVAATQGDRLSFYLPADADTRRERALGLLDRFGLRSVADRPVSELAGGVRKLLDIAMALARHPKVLLLDEPTAGVAREEKFPAMDRIVHGVERQAGTVVFVEHDMEVVRRYADRVVAFYSGRILADGGSEEVLEDPEVRRHVTGGRR